MKLICYSLCSFICACLPTVWGSYSFALEDSLRTTYLDTGYNTFARPLANVEVTLALNLITLNSLSISEQTMSIAGYLTMKWSDNRLDWSSDPSYSSTIPAIYSNENYVWRPALIIENSVKDISVISDENVLMRLESTGNITWTPSGIYVTHCETDVTFYPFDTQECDVTVSTWGYTSIEITLFIASEAVRLSYYKENGEWSYEGFSTTSATNTREGSSTPQVSFKLKFKRRPAFHVLNSLIPMVLLALLSSIVFKLPPDSGEKMGYTLTVLLAYAVYLTIISDDLPSTSNSTAILTIYLLLVLALGVLSVIITIYVLDCHHKDEDVPVPKWLTRLSTGCLAKFACWKDYKCLCGRQVYPDGNRRGYPKETEMKGNHSDEKRAPFNDKECTHDSLTWKDICHVLDAFFLSVSHYNCCNDGFIVSGIGDWLCCQMNNQSKIGLLIARNTTYFQ
ncbi:unnamed protein product [Mytilus edulis]|uniref:Uncharacterized protein n=1 Tax=Mytilus edulis TaxID=6550 RepID=A0A8S3R8W1_MYTED|nr:unnamed protein product [Mytilus edulis]